MVIWSKPGFGLFQYYYKFSKGFLMTVLDRSVYDVDYSGEKEFVLFRKTKDRERTSFYMYLDWAVQDENLIQPFESVNVGLECILKRVNHPNESWVPDKNRSTSIKETTAV